MAVHPAAPFSHPQTHPKVVIHVGALAAPQAVRGRGVGAVAPLALQAGASSHLRSRQGLAPGFVSPGAVGLLITKIHPGIHLHGGDLEVEHAAVAQPALRLGGVGAVHQAEKRLKSQEKQNRENSITS